MCRCSTGWVVNTVVVGWRLLLILGSFQPQWISQIQLFCENEFALFSVYSKYQNGAVFSVSFLNYWKPQWNSIQQIVSPLTSFIIICTLPSDSVLSLHLISISLTIFVVPGHDCFSCYSKRSLFVDNIIRD